jgi:beta-lactamase superfamily II metal-dependent hydrolase
MDVSNAYNDEDTDEEKAVKSSKEREEMRNRTHVPSNKTNYNQKKEPDNPIDYLKTKLKVSSIFRFIISHPDMDHLDGIKDTDNDKDIDLNNFFGGYNKEDWKFYKNLRAGKNTDTKRLTYFSKQSNQYYNEDDITILCPTAELVKNGNDTEDYNDASYAILFTPPKKDGGKWKILLAGDTHDDSWDYILKNHKSEVSNIDVLFAPHHGRDSDRNYDFLDTLKPKVTLFGNASSKHLAYNKYPKIRITNNQAGFVILDTTEEHLKVYVKNFEFAKDFRAERGWDAPQFNSTHQAYFLFMYNA